VRSTWNDDAGCVLANLKDAIEAKFMNFDTCYPVVINETTVDDFYGLYDIGSLMVRSCDSIDFYQDRQCEGDYIAVEDFATDDREICQGPAENSFRRVCYEESASSGDKNGICFAGSETVLFESGEVKLISEVAVGDRVQVPGGFSEVVAVPHGRNEIPTSFVEITTGFGDSVKMSPAHLVSAGSCGSSLPLAYAKDVRVGDCVMTGSGVQAVVSSVKDVQGKGIYSFVTREEFIVVGNVVASPFAVNHFVPNMFYNIHRALPAGSPILKVYSAVAQKVVDFATSPLIMRLVGS
jgi:hypothetical protein